MTAPLLPALPGYESPQLIAHGTTALVFRAIQTRLNRAVAIKVITAETTAGSVPVNVERELATTVALSSQPHIVSIIDTGVTADDRRYIVMEYCEGGSYAQILRQHGPLPVEDVVDVGIKIGQALHAAHEAGIVHRDVKPSNVLRSRFGPALTDFGIARAPDELGGTLTREMMTPHHASPEALLHQAQSGLSDLFSLASTMWTLLVGHPPFVDPGQPDMDMYVFRDRVLHEPLPPMERADVPQWLVAELRRAMSKVPAQRHASALEFSEALQRGALGLPAPSTFPAESPRPAHSPDTQGDMPVRQRYAPFTPPSPAPAMPSPAPVVPAQASPADAPPGTSPGNGHPSDEADDDGPPIYRPARLSPPAAVPASPAAVTPALVSAASGALTSSAPTSGAPTSGAPTSGAPTSGAPTSGAPTSGGPAASLGSRTIEGSDWTGAPARGAGRELEPANPRSRRDWAVPASGPSRPNRVGFIAFVTGVTLLAVASGVMLILSIRDRGGPAAPPATPPATTTAATAGPAPGAPTDVTIDADHGTFVTLSWTDPTGGLQSYVAFQLGPGGTDDARSQQVPRGGTNKSVTFTELDENMDYCFRVGAILSNTDVRVSDTVCTSRAS